MNKSKDLYPTRSDKERMLERKDPIVFSGEKQSPYGLEPEEVAFYEKNGFIVFPGFFSTEEVSLFQAEHERLKNLEELKGRDELICEPDSREARSIFSPQKFSEIFDRLSRDERIIEKVRQLLGSEVYIHHSRINIKPAYCGKSFPWHSDFETWHAEDGIPKMRVLTGWVMLTDNNEFNGPLYLVPGSHKRFVSCAGQTPLEHHKASLRKQEYGVPSLEAVKKLISESSLVGAYGPAGTLVFHESNIMHGSPDNISPWDRTNLFFVYNSVKNTPANEPFGASKLRPEFLRNSDFTPIEPVTNNFVK